MLGVSFDCLISCLRVGGGHGDRDFLIATTRTETVGVRDRDPRDCERDSETNRDHKDCERDLRDCDRDHRDCERDSETNRDHRDCERLRD